MGKFQWGQTFFFGEIQNLPTFTITCPGKTGLREGGREKKATITISRIFLWGSGGESPTLFYSEFYIFSITSVLLTELRFCQSRCTFNR